MLIHILLLLDVNQHSTLSKADMTASFIQEEAHKVVWNGQSHSLNKMHYTTRLKGSTGRFVPQSRQVVS